MIGYRATCTQIQQYTKKYTLSIYNNNGTVMAHMVRRRPFKTTQMSLVTHWIFEFSFHSALGCHSLNILLLGQKDTGKSK
jgi:hypothetical protein